MFLLAEKKFLENFIQPAIQVFALVGEKIQKKFLGWGIDKGRNGVYIKQAWFTGLLENWTVQMLDVRKRNFRESERTLDLMESLILAQDERWRRA